jgi:riboflavin synthase alpha subunit
MIYRDPSKKSKYVCRRCSVFLDTIVCTCCNSDEDVFCNDLIKESFDETIEDDFDETIEESFDETIEDDFDETIEDIVNETIEDIVNETN